MGREGRKGSEWGDPVGVQAKGFSVREEDWVRAGESRRPRAPWMRVRRFELGVRWGGGEASLTGLCALSLGRVVKEEISDDSARLPCFNGRVVSWVSGRPSQATRRSEPQCPRPTRWRPWLFASSAAWRASRGPSAFSGACTASSCSLCAHRKHRPRSDPPPAPLRVLGRLTSRSSRFLSLHFSAGVIG